MTLQVTSVAGDDSTLNVQVSELAADGSVLHQEDFSFDDTLTPAEALDLIRDRFDDRKAKRTNLDKLRKGLTVGREIPSS